MGPYRSRNIGVIVIVPVRGIAELARKDAIDRIDHRVPTSAVAAVFSETIVFRAHGHRINVVRCPDLSHSDQITLVVAPELVRYGTSWRGIPTRSPAAIAAARKICEVRVRRLIVRLEKRVERNAHP